MENGKDYCVEVRASFLLNSGSSEGQDDKALANVRQAFARDEALWDNIIGGLEVQADGQRAQIRYLFACHDESEAKAERFSADCIRNVQKELEVFGCKLEKLECAAEEVVPERQDQAEHAASERNGQPKEVKPLPSRKKRTGQER